MVTHGKPKAGLDSGPGGRGAGDFFLRLAHPHSQSVPKSAYSARTPQMAPLRPDLRPPLPMVCPEGRSSILAPFSPFFAQIYVVMADKWFYVK